MLPGGQGCSEVKQSVLAGCREYKEAMQRETQIYKAFTAGNHMSLLWIGQGEHTNSTPKGIEPSCCKAAVQTTVPKCHPDFISLPGYFVPEVKADVLAAVIFSYLSQNMSFEVICHWCTMEGMKHVMLQNTHQWSTESHFQVEHILRQKHLKCRFTVN